MGRKKKRHPAKRKYSRWHIERVFSETDRGKRIIDASKRARESRRIVVDFNALAYALEQQIYLYVEGDWKNHSTRPRRLEVSEKEAMDLYLMHAQRRTLSFALGKYVGPYGKGTRFAEPSIAEAIIDFFADGKHLPYVKKE